MQSLGRALAAILKADSGTRPSGPGLRSGTAVQVRRLSCLFKIHISEGELPLLCVFYLPYQASLVCEVLFDP